MEKLAEWEENCLLLLSEMNAGAEQRWSKGKAQIYRVILQELGEQASRAAVTQAIKTEEWRPSAARLREIALTVASPLPPVGALWTEFWHKAIHAGYRTARWTHPVLETIAANLGGWRHIYGNYWPDSDPHRVEALRRRFDAAYLECAAQWREAVAAQLTLPPASRNPRFFPAAKTFTPPPSLPPGNQEGTASLADREPAEKVREQLAAMGAGKIAKPLNGKERA